MKKGDLVLVSHIFIHFTPTGVVKSFVESYGVITEEVKSNLAKVYVSGKNSIEKIHTTRIKLVK